MVDRLPHDLSAEAAVIAAAVVDDSGESLDVARAILKAESFFDPRHRRIFTAMCSLSDAGQPRDLVTIWSQLRSDQVQSVKAEYLAQVIDETPSVANIAGHARIVQDHYLVRQAIGHAHRLAGEGYKFEGMDSKRVREYLRSAEQMFADLSLSREGRRLRHVGDVLVDVARTLSTAFEQRSPVVGQSTGFKELDRLTAGLHDGDLVVTAGRPGMGKTAFGLNLAVNVARSGSGVAFFSLEMPAEQLVLRLVSAESGVDLTKLRTGLFDPGMWEPITRAMDALSRMPIFVDDTAGINMFDVRARARSLQRELEAGRHPSATERRLGLVEVDYAQLLSPHKDCRTREEEISSISHCAKETAKELNIVLNLLAQLNREVEKRPDKKPRLSDLRESGSIEQDADLVLLLYRAAYYKSREEELDEEERNLGEVLVAKQRNGPTGAVRLVYRKHCTRFMDLVEDYNFDQYDDGAGTTGDLFQGLE
jgi:replicative DNA helicase